jgi:hypothetical protein
MEIHDGTYHSYQLLQYDCRSGTASSLLISVLLIVDIQLFLVFRAFWYLRLHGLSIAALAQKANIQNFKDQANVYKITQTSAQINLQGVGEMDPDTGGGSDVDKPNKKKDDGSDKKRSKGKEKEADSPRGNTSQKGNIQGAVPPSSALCNGYATLTTKHRRYLILNEAISKVSFLIILCVTSFRIE